MLLTKSDGAAVCSALRTGEVGRAEASWLASGARRKRRAGSFVGRVIPAWEALWGVSEWVVWVMQGREGSWGAERVKS